jgi:hypothetical protein
MKIVYFKNYIISYMPLSFNKLVPNIIRQKVKSTASVLSDNDRFLIEICSVSVEECLSILGSSKDGLSDEDVIKYREKFGVNELSKKEKKIFFLNYLTDLKIRWLFNFLL